MSILILLLLCHVAAQVRQTHHHEHGKVIPSHYVDYPIERHDFDNWHTDGAAFFGKNKIVLVPEVKDRRGYFYNKEPVTHRSWVVEIEFKVGN